jgi:agmatine/peptidylarginine deiminase
MRLRSATAWTWNACASSTVPYDDTWLRDSGPITCATAGRVPLLDFRFTGWGGKYEASDDDQLIGACMRTAVSSIFIELLISRWKAAQSKPMAPAPC